VADKILLFIPCYNCGPQIARVIGQITPELQALLAEVLVVDNRSTDNGQEVAVAALKQLDGVATRLVENDRNYGLGGSHKVAFQHALEHGFTHLIVLHGDDQGDISDLLPYLRDGSFRSVDALLGARFMRGSRLVGYSAVRTLGNRVFNTLYSLAAGKRIYDLGSGLNLYKVEALADRWWLGNADDLTFNYHMILRSIAAKWKLRFFPLSWREEDQVSNVKLVRQSLRVLSLPAAYAAKRRAYLQKDYSRRPEGGYTSHTIFERRPATAS
jgi:glycosyltransferase involved in cell wall biosynthesis